MKTKIMSDFQICISVPLTGVHFRGELQHVSDVSKQKFNYGLIRTLEMTDIRLLHELYVNNVHCCKINTRVQ